MNVLEKIQELDRKGWHIPYGLNCTCESEIGSCSVNNPIFWKNVAKKLGININQIPKNITISKQNGSRMLIASLKQYLKTP